LGRKEPEKIPFAENATDAVQARRLHGPAGQGAVEGAKVYLAIERQAATLDKVEGVERRGRRYLGCHAEASDMMRPDAHALRN